MLLVSVATFAQKKIEVTGVVTDTNKEPLVGVNVTVKDQAGLGAITDINGRYKISIEEFSRLVFSYIGFDKQEVLVKRQQVVNVIMKEFWKQVSLMKSLLQEPVHEEVNT